MEITINEKTYKFKAGFRFLDYIEKYVVRDINGEQIDWGLTTCYYNAFELGDSRYLAKMLIAMNKGLKPELKKEELENYIEDLNEDELNNLYSEVRDFLLSVSVCRLKIKKMGLLSEPNETSVQA